MKSRIGEFIAQPVAMCPNHPVEGSSFTDVRRFVAEMNRGRSNGRTHRVEESKVTNKLGLFDMHGNVAEWTNSVKSVGEFAFYEHFVVLVSVSYGTSNGNETFDY